MSSNKTILNTLLTTGLATVLSFLISFFLTPEITSRLGSEAYGFISLASTIVSYATIAMTALNSYATRFIAVEFHKGNTNSASRYFSTLVISSFVLSTTLFCVLLFVGVNIGSLVIVPNRLLVDVKCLMILVFVNFYITMASTCFSASAYIRNKLDVYGVFQTISYVVEAAVLLFCYTVLTTKIYYYGLGILAAGGVLLAGNLYIFNKYTPDIKIKISYFSCADLKTLLLNGIWNSINSIGNTLNSGIDLLIANLMLSPLAMGQLAISKTFSSVISRLIQLVSQAFQPMFLKFYSSSSSEMLDRQFTNSIFSSGYVSNLMFAGFFALCPVFYSLWIPDQNIELIYYLTMLTVACSLFEGPVNPLYYVYTLKIKNKIPCFVTLFGGLINVVGMFLLLKYTSLGVFSIPLMTTIVMGFINLVFNPIYIAYCLGKRAAYFYKYLVRVYLSAAAMCFSFLLVSLVLSPNSWLSFLLSCLICLTLSIPIHSVICWGPGLLVKLASFIIK